MIDERTVPPIIKNLESKFTNKDSESLMSESNKVQTNPDNLFDNFGFNQIKI